MHPPTARTVCRRSRKVRCPQKTIDTSCSLSKFGRCSILYSYEEDVRVGDNPGIEAAFVICLRNDNRLLFLPKTSSGPSQLLRDACNNVADRAASEITIRQP